MNRVFWWKMRRELKRLGKQLLNLPGEVLRWVYFRRWYDFQTSRAIRRTSGHISIGDEVGIYLIFPKNGLLATHLTMIEEMRQAKISPVIVSNLPLSEDDRAQLIPIVARIIERPNVGYDFGGYRDGFLELAPELACLEKVWMLNDSVWLVPQSTSWFNAARALNTDLVAATSNFAMQKVDPHRYREITWKYSTSHKNFHYASYAIGFGKRILRDPEFMRYWRKLQITNDKTRTVRRGEIGLTQWALRHDFSHAATYDVSKLDEELSRCENIEIDRIARELVIPDDAALESLQEDVLRTDFNTEGGRLNRIALILTTVSRRASAYALPAYSLRRGFHFLKKSPLWLSSGGATAMAKLIAKIEGPMGDDIRSEAIMLLRADDKKLEELMEGPFNG
ncbi:rhamnan synthesis F family protein [Agrobacterium deltaense]|uniref:rhamnan synthesis F family protein n=1 Tax=Agrobacterium deltaense TaxID=1183412 RepID=UPI003D98E2DD